MRVFLKFLFASFIIFPWISEARINMQSGSYTENWIDVIASGDGPVFKIERFYDSRSIFIGTFGFGWCSQFETKIQKKSDGTIVLTECGGGVEMTYYPTYFDKVSPQDTTKQIIDHYKKTKKNSDLKEMEKTLLSSTRDRFEEANRLHIIDASSFKNKVGSFSARLKEFEQIDFNGIFYTRKNTNGNTEKYDNQGRLVEIVDKKNQWIRIKYRKYNGTYNRISSIFDNRNRRFNFFYEKSGKLWKIQDEKNVKVLYKFESENLVQVTNAWGNTYKYFYDRNSNMTKIRFPKRNGKVSFISISYNLNRDWVRSYKDRQGCQQKFRFIASQSKDNYKSLMTGKCSNKLSNAQFEYWYKNYKKSKSKYLFRNFNTKRTTALPSRKSTSSSEDIYFHPYFGEPTFIKLDLKTISYLYYSYGLPFVKEEKIYNTRNKVLFWDKILFKYNLKNYNIKNSVRKVFDPKGKVKSTFYTSFIYDNNNFLRKVQKKSGSFVNIHYNKKGQISSLSDHKKNNLLFIYDEFNNRPVRIKHTSLGEVFLEYAPDGEIFRTHSKKGGSVAARVIENLVYFLKILGPVAQQQLKI